MKNSFYFLQYFKAITSGLNKASYCINSLKVDPNDLFDTINNELISLKKNKGKLYFFGNGASSSFANHMSLDFSKNGKINSRSLSDSSFLTALANDFNFAEIFTEFLKIENVASNDLVVTISSSGNSSNILNVLEYCKKNGIKTLALSGLKEDSKSIKMSTYSIHVPMKTYGIVECIHQIILHLILDNFMQIFEWEKVEFQNMNNLYFKL